MHVITWLAQLLVIIGAINWGIVGLFHVNVIGAIFGGPTSMAARTIYTLIGIAGLIAIPGVAAVRGRNQNPNRGGVR